MTLNNALVKAFDYVIRVGEDVPPDIWSKAIRAGVFKAEASDLAAINAEYHDGISEALLEYLEGGGSVAAPKNMFKRATLTAFGDAFDLGWIDGGGELPIEGAALEWIEARIQQEFGFIEMVFQQAKELRGSEDFDPLAWASERADGYVRTVGDIYSHAKLMAAGNKMLTFAGKDGKPDNICQSTNGTCVKLKGKRHKASWWIAHGLVPYRGNPNYDCGAWECSHGLYDDEGNRFAL